MMQKETFTELAIPDLQRRLIILGYKLDDEAEKGLFGEKTAAAVASFKASTGLGYDDVIDQSTWTTLVDASMQIGDRLLYLHMPNFRGRDVGELQAALSSMGFTCTVDNIFGSETEQALREFQVNMSLPVSGILNEESLVAIMRLRHIWEGKRGFFVEGRSPATARSLKALEDTTICVFGRDEPTRAIANRIANLARATTPEAGIVSASSLASDPGNQMLLIGLKQASDSGTSNTNEGDEANVPQVTVREDAAFEEELKEAVVQAQKLQRRVILLVDALASESENLVMNRQSLSTLILDTLCKVLEKPTTE